MMAEVSKFDYIHRIIFVNPIRSIRDIFKKRSNRGKTVSIFLGEFISSKVQKKIWSYVPLHFLPLKNKFGLLDRIEKSLIRLCIKTLNAGRPYILFINNTKPYFHFIISELMKNAVIIVFDFSDDFVEYFGPDRLASRKVYLEHIKKYAKAADIVFSANDHIKRKYEHLNQNIHVIRNATNFNNFHREKYRSVDVLERIKSKNRVLLGYTGTINNLRLDFQIIDLLLKMLPSFAFIFIGRADPYFLRHYSEKINVYYFPPVDYQFLPDYIQYFDVAIVPFKINEHTKGNDLLKFHDYLAMGKPVVSTNTGGAFDLQDVIKIAQNPSDFISSIKDALLTDTPMEIAKRKKVAMKNCWSERGQEIYDLMKTKIMSSKIRSFPGESYRPKD